MLMNQKPAYQALEQQIVALKQENDRLRSESNKYRTLFNFFPFGITVSDSSGQIIESNAIAEKLLGVPKEEHETRAIDGQEWKIIRPDGSDMPSYEWASVIALTEKRLVTHCEMGIVTPQDLVTWIDVTAAPLPGDGGGVVITYTDISEKIKFRKKQTEAEDALRESQEKYRSIMGAMDESVYICSADFQIEYMNPAMIKWLGRDATGETCHKVIYGSDIKCPGCVHETVMKGETIKTERAGPEGDKIYFISHSPIFHPDGTVSKLTLYRDITENKKLENRIQQAQKMESIGNLAGGIAHDFNNILFPIIGMSELLLYGMPQGSSEREGVEEILKAGKRGSDLVKQILAFSRQSDHKMIPTRVQSILKEVLKLIRSSIPSNIEISQDIPPDCGLILADPIQIHQVAMNLITNAYHAVEKTGGQIHVQLREVTLKMSDRPDSNKFAGISISDTGHGIPENIINRIFDPYFTTKVKGKGTGLGLAVVHGIVKGHKGDVILSSEIGKGSTFTVYLPVLEKSTSDDAISLDKDCPSGTERILLVDDEVAIAKVEKRMLERFGYRVTMRISSHDALEAFTANPSNFDLVISDMAMPIMTGKQLAEELRNIRPDIPIIICTGFSDRISEKKAQEMGIDGFMMKPIVKSDLSNMVRKVLDESQAKINRY